MPQFANIESVFGTSMKKSMSKEETVRALRLAIAAELETASLYEQIAEGTADASVREIMYDIAREEQVHVGELLHMIEKVNKREKDAYEEGEDEAAEKVG